MGSLRRGMMAGGDGGGTDPHFANVVSLLHFDGANGSTTFTDVTGRAWTAQNGADIRTDVSKFGGASGWFQNTPGSGSENGSRIMTPDAADLQFGTGDFTVEGWFIPQTPLLGLGAFYRKGQNTAGGLQLAVTPTQLTLRADSATDTNVAVSLSTSTWSHIAFTRQAGLVRFFVNGDLVGSAMRTFNHTDTEALFIGSVTSDTRFSYRGRIDDLRITKGVARYTANFTPPSAPFPSGGGSPPAQAWNPGVLSPPSVLSVSNKRLTANTSASGVYANARGLLACSGKCYFSVEINVNASGSVAGAGVADAATDLTNASNYPGVDNKSVEAGSPNGQVFFNGGNVGSVGTMATNDVVEVAVDVSTRRIWLRQSGGAWAGGGDPATGTTPTAILSGTGSIYPAAWVAKSGAGSSRYVQIHTTAGETVGTPPAGFTAANWGT